MTLELLEQLVIAAKEGKTLQQKWRGRTDSQWHDIPPHELLKGLMCCMDYDWRIKPEPREWWVNDYLGDENLGADGTRWHRTKDEADKYADRGRKRLLRIREVEVTEFR